MKTLYVIRFLIATTVLVGATLCLGQSQSEDQANAEIEGAVASATNGQLLARARVFLRRMAQKDDFVTWTEADDNGHFIFKALVSGPYEILAEKSGFFTDPHKAPNPALDVKPGDHVHGIVLRLLPLAVIRGRIVNEHNDPVQDTQVRLLDREYVNGRERLNQVRLATADDRGEYRIYGIRPGNYYLVVEYDVKKARPNPFPAVPVQNAPPQISYPPLFYPLTSDLRQAQRVTVVPGADLIFDFAFSSTRSVAVEGKVVNGLTGEPIKNPTIVAFWGDRITSITRKVDVAVTGEFRLDGIEPGPYTLSASVSVEGQNYTDFRVVEVGAAGLKDVELALMPDFGINGQIQFENSQSDNVQNGIPRRVSVEFMPLERNTGTFRASAQLHSQPSAAENRSILHFTAKLHPGDHYRVGLPNLPQDYYLKSILIDGHEVSASQVSIQSGGSELVLVASPSGGHIQGIVRNGKGQPVSGQVILAADVYRLTAEQVRSVRTDNQGRFTLRGVTPGNYKLYAWEELDLNELLGQLDLLKNFESESQLVHVEESGTYNPELKAIARQ